MKYGVWRLHIRYLRLQTHTHNIYYLLLFHSKHGRRSAPQFYVLRNFLVLLSIISIFTPLSPEYYCPFTISSYDIVYISHFPVRAKRSANDVVHGWAFLIIWYECGKQYVYISWRFWSATIFLFLRLLSRQILLFFSARWSLLLIRGTMYQKQTRFKVTVFIPFTSWAVPNISQYVSFFTMRDVTPIFWLLISKNASSWKRFYKYKGYLKGKKQIRNK
jgi:hypothetical protein